MKFIPNQDWRQKIETLQRLTANVRAKNKASRFKPPELTDEQREAVERVTRFEMRGGRVVKQNWRRVVVTNA